ncbi:MAG: hypothetical protein ACLP8S_26790 [Solirubrobacteraceae bacterium]
MFTPLAALAAAFAAALAGLGLSDSSLGVAASPSATTSTASTVVQPPSITATIPNRPPATVDVQAPAAPSDSPVFAAVSQAFRTMTSTVYTHTYYWNAATGVYQFDCVGLADYFLSLGAPHALAALRAAEHTPIGYVPSPDHFADYLQALPTHPNRFWLPITHARHIKPGDLIIMRAVTSSTKNVFYNSKVFVGHAMIAASAPLLLANGAFALNVFDSTGAPLHGRDDSRYWDPRTMTAGASTGSGLGFGTIELWVSQAGAPERISWSIGAAPVDTPIVIARALQ